MRRCGKSWCSSVKGAASYPDKHACAAGQKCGTRLTGGSVWSHLWTSSHCYVLQQRVRTCAQSPDTFPLWLPRLPAPPPQRASSPWGPGTLCCWRTASARKRSQDVCTVHNRPLQMCLNQCLHHSSPWPSAALWTSVQYGTPSCQDWDPWWFGWPGISQCVLAFLDQQAQIRTQSRTFLHWVDYVRLHPPCAARMRPDTAVPSPRCSPHLPCWRPDPGTRSCLRI